MGYAKVYSFETTGWVQIGNDIIGESEDDKSGFSVAIAKTTALLRVHLYLWSQVRNPR